MTTRIADMSPRTAAVIAGIGYLGIFGLAIFANFVVRTGLIESGDAAATAANIQDSEALFRFGLVAFIIVFVLDVVVAWALYIFFVRLSRELSLVTAWFRLVYTVFLGVAAIFFFIALDLLGASDYLNVFDTPQLNAQALLALDAFNYTWLVGLVSFGVHLVLLGYLVVKSRYTTAVLGYVLMLAGVAYMVDTAANALLANYDDYANVFLVLVAVPSVVGELWLTIWLLVRAGKEPDVATTA